jgi:steroid Delta-isomerase
MLADQDEERHMDQQQPRDRSFLTDCERIYREWHERAKNRDTEGLLALYAEDAVLESPLVPAILDGWGSGTLRGHPEMRHFFEEGARRRPNDLVRWYRTGKWLTDRERWLVWEYPCAAPDGDQVDLVEVMEIADGLIQHHRVYWGWFGTGLLTCNAAEKAKRNVSAD